jgi:hypothetical protein
LIDRGGLLYVSPIAWYSTARRWDAAPGYEPLTHPRFERRANDECLTCHAGRLAYDRRLPDRYAKPPFLEEAIGCERCHGPGAGHVRFHTAVDGPGLADAIVNPAKLDAATREDICNRCHLSDDVRLLRHGRSIFDFRPGQRLEDVWTVFIGVPRGPAGGATTRSVNQVHQMHESRCFQASSGRLGCISCHDPHGIPDEAGRIAFYNERCLNCHRDDGCTLPEMERMTSVAEGSCIACHMPPLAASNVPHTAQTNHRIPRLLNVPPARPRRKLRFFDGSDARLPPLEVERARVLMQLFQPDHRPVADEGARLAYSLLSITDRFPDDVDAWAALGNLHLLENRPAEAERCWRQALRLRPLHEGVLKSLAILQGGQKDLSKAIATSRQLLRADPWQAGYHLQLAQFLDESGDLQQTLTEVEAALEINPTVLSVREWLAAAYRKLGRTDDALREERLIEQMRNQ